MITTLAKEWIRRQVEPLAKALARTGLSPNVLTISGLFLNALVAFLLASGFEWQGGLLLIVAGIFDLMDGALARITNKATRFGALLDSVIDRLSEAVLFFGLLWLYTFRGSSVEVLLIYVVLVGSVVISYVKARSEGLGIPCEVGLLARPERLALLAIGLIFGQIRIVLWVLAVLTFFTVGQRVLYVWLQTRGEEKPGTGDQQRPVVHSFGSRLSRRIGKG